MPNGRSVRSSTVRINHVSMEEFKEKIASTKRNECELDAETLIRAGEMWD